MSAITVRAAEPEDAPEIAQLHWDSWVASYSHIFPPATFAGFPLASREALWRSTAMVAKRAPAQRQQLRVAVGPSAVPPVILGFACVGPLRDNGHLRSAPQRGELWALYLRPDALRRGVGRALFADSMQCLREAGFAEMYQWVLGANAGAIAFYRAQGCELVGARMFDADGVAVEELCFRSPLDAGAGALGLST